MSDTEARWNISIPVVVSVAAAVYAGGIMAPLYIIYSKISKGFPDDKLMTGCTLYFGVLPLCLIALPSPVAKYWSTYQPHRENMKWWMCLGGVIGVTKVCMMAFSKTLLQFSVQGMTYNTGQVACSVLMDHIGFLGTPKKRLNRWTPLALLLFVGGCLMNMVSIDEETQKYVITTHWATSISFAAGLLNTLQYCFNRRLGGTLPYKVQFNGINYFTGAVFIAFVWHVIYFVHAGNDYKTPPGAAWYYYILPGLIGFSTNLTSVKFAPKIGVAAYAMIAIVVETCTNQSIDLISGKMKFNWFNACGLMMTLSATLLHGIILHHRNTLEARELLELEKSGSDHDAENSQSEDEDAVEVKDSSHITL